MNAEKFDLLKSHVAAYTRADGAVVQAHDDSRAAAVAKPPAAARAKAQPQTGREQFEAQKAQIIKKHGAFEDQHVGHMATTDQQARHVSNAMGASANAMRTNSGSAHKRAAEENQRVAGFMRGVNPALEHFHTERAASHRQKAGALGAKAANPLDQQRMKAGIFKLTGKV